MNKFVSSAVVIPKSSLRKIQRIAKLNFLTFAGYISQGEEVKIKYNFYWNMDGSELEEAKGELTK